MQRKKLTRNGQHLHQAVAEDIGTRILRGEFAPGSLLPNEARWCRSYKISRTAVREAIKMLAAKGLIVSRTKIGSRVQPRERWNFLDRDMLAWYCKAMDRRKFLDSIQEVRLVLEPEPPQRSQVLQRPPRWIDDRRHVEQHQMKHGHCRQRRHPAEGAVAEQRRNRVADHQNGDLPS